MTAMPVTLEEIVAHKREEVARAAAQVSLEEMRERALRTEQPRNFFRAVTRQRTSNSTAIIAEIKRRSPSAGLLRPEYEGEGFQPERFALRYAQCGASAISCLTDEKFFGGAPEFIARVKAAAPIPVLRKDFIVDPWQIWESRALGADAVLLIAECLTESQIVDMLILSQQLGMTTLLEVHEPDNLLRVRHHIGFPHPAFGLLGINNRNLRTMRTDLSQTLRLAELVEDRSVLVSESGISIPRDLSRLRSVGVRIALVGEHLMRQDDPGEALLDLLGPG